MENDIDVIIEQTSNLACLPKYAGLFDAGADVYAMEDAYIYPGKVCIIPLGFKMELPPGWEMQVRSRSGLAIKESVIVWNSPGTIDSSFRHECGVILYNGGDKTYKVKAGDRIAQFVLKKAPRANFIQGVVDNTNCRGGGFGSSGK